MADQVGMNFGGMDHLLLTLRDANLAIGATLDELDERVATLRDQWSGAASDAYDEAQQRSRDQLHQMNGILSRSHSTADVILARHRAASAQVAKLWA